MRGYDRKTVDAFLARCARTLDDRVHEFPELVEFSRPLEQGQPVSAADVRDVRFPVVLRGYELLAVDGLLRRVEAALRTDDEPVHTWTSGPVPPAIAPGPGLRTTLRGYAPEEVDRFLVRCAHSLGAAVARFPELAALTGQPRIGPPLTVRDVEQATFRLQLHGYAPRQVDELLDRVQAALAD